MANIYVYASNMGTNTDVPNSDFTGSYSFLSKTSTQCTEQWANGQIANLVGTNIVYNSGGNAEFSSGTLTGLQIEASNGYVQMSLTGLSYPFGVGNPGSTLQQWMQTFTGGVADTFYVNGGGDTVNAYGSANTVILGSKGNFIIGDAGTTTVVFHDPRADYTVTATGTSGTYIVAETAGPGTDGTTTVANVTSLQFSDQTITPAAGLIAIDTAAQAVASYQNGQVANGVSVVDSAANVQANLDGLQTISAAGKLSSITLSDSGTPTMTVTAAQLAHDAAALGDISAPGGFVLSITAPTTSATITGIANDANVVTFTGAAAQYTIAAGTNGAITVTNGTTVDTISGVQQLQFADHVVTVEENGGNGELAALLYQASFNRSPDPHGLVYWTGQATTQSWTQISTGFVTSPEFQTKYGSLTNDQFVTQLYANILDRAPDSGGYAYWMGQLAGGQTREQVLDGFGFSQEAINNATQGFTGQSGHHAAWLFLV